MAFQWVRAVTITTASVAIAAAGALLSTPALAATTAACKSHPSSAACKPAAKKTVAKTSSAVTTVKGRQTHVIGKTTAKGKKGKVVAKHAISPEALLASVSHSPGGNDVAALRSSTAYVQDMRTSTVLFAKNENVVRPIASISKLMTALVVLDAHQPMDEMIEVTEEDIDQLKHTSSRLPVGSRLSRNDMLHLALMASENRAANSLGRSYPGGLPAFVAAMNAKARSLGMINTHFVEPTGLSFENVSSPQDLALMLRAASQQPLIHEYTTASDYTVQVKSRMVTFRNTDMLVRRPDWDIKVSKTGFINEAGQCLVMMARIEGRDMAIVLLDSRGSLSRIGDAVRIRRILEHQIAML
jgi:D-alanyl-D-alanine endopeptidase (penicillin-binding protein 7)